jgi:hypothetical protein
MVYVRVDKRWLELVSASARTFAGTLCDERYIGHIKLRDL